MGNVGVRYFIAYKRWSKLYSLYFNSIGGTALEVGSIKVNTINLARIAYESEGDKYEYLKILRERTKLCLDVLDTIRNIIKRNIEKGLLPNYSYSLLSMKSQYNSIGIIGIYEALKYFDAVQIDGFGNSSYTNAGVEFAEEILRTINQVKDEYTKDKDYSANIEQVPKKCGHIAA